MQEHHPAPSHRSAEEVPAHPEPSTQEDELIWAISDAILRTVEAAAIEPDVEAYSTAARIGVQLIQHVYGFDLSNESQQQVVAQLGNSIADAIVGISDRYDEMTTSDVQGAVGALAVRIVQRGLTARPPQEERDTGEPL